MINQSELAKQLKITQSTVSDWENQRSEPDIETIKKLAIFFDVSTDYLLGNTDEWGNTQQNSIIKTPPPLTDEEREALQLFRAISPKDRSKIITALSVYADAEQARNTTKKGG